MLELIQDYIEKLKNVDKQLETLLSDRKIIETELSALTKAIKRQSRVFGAIVSMSNECSFIIDRNATFTYASIAGAQLLGLKQLDVIGKNWRELGLPREVMVPFEAHLKTAFLLGTSVTNVAKVQFPYGIRYMEYYLNPVLGKTLNVDAVFCVIRDVTQHKESETVQQQLTLQYLHENQRLQQLTDAAPMAILTVDGDGFITAINQAAIELLPHISDSFKGPKLYRTSLKLHNDTCGGALIARALNGEEIKSGLFEYNDRHYLISAFPTREKDTGVILGAVAFYQDITEVEKLRKELARLDRLNLIGEMAAGVAHEIRNPMTVVMGYLQMLSGRAEDGLQEKYDIIMEELNRINAIVTDFLSLAKDKLVEKESSNLNEIINSIYPLIMADATKNDIEVKLVLADDMPELLLNEKEIKQLILNLVRNAIEAMKADCRRLGIETHVHDDKVELITSDSGCGIDSQHLNKIFDPFFTTKDNGTGLGLAVCQSIVDRHKGSVEIRSEIGRGTAVIVTLPRS
ncbi:PAS domain-containing protein|uniref:histidine kinase n=1 Tax=Dendrosporobacter quercicolus TaxID=146817 RepID=A0A1G9P5K6_9FIRM|nr:ATP-binding protein [Dendrosporobacter quercicolus]NSL47551.1 PAS domain-containing protein [Dendrosporobacter quercicolus DSM 1736]SDL94076.1 PAS domain S-box-containing protein [Dendrosporobacter quercicolus]